MGEAGDNDFKWKLNFRDDERTNHYVFPSQLLSGNSLIMKSLARLLIPALLSLTATAIAKDMHDVPGYVTKAITDSSRPAGDTEQDVNRKPVEVMVFAGAKPKQKIVDLMPGYGYYTRIFSKIVGPKGKVFAVEPEELSERFPKQQEAIKQLTTIPEYTNITALIQPVAKINLPEQADMVWTSMNYHDLHNPLLGSPDMAAFNKSVFDALRPGGIFVVLDHAAAPDSGFTVTNTLHRADPAAVKAEVTAAGFEFVGESDVLRNPDDDHTLNVFDKSLRGKTDKFILKFRKPKH